MPLRLAYVGSVFRYEPPRASRQHEFTQAGVELIGAAGALADAEAVALAVAALQAVGLPEFRLTVGHVGFFRGLLTALGLPERAAGRLRTAVDRKAEAELAQLLAEIPDLPPLARNAVLTLPRLTGDARVLTEAEAICLNTTMMQALADLRAMAELLAVFGVADRVSYDLAEVRDLDYYTGITFEGFAPGLGFNLISGGRYDELIGHFGPSLAAVGWALTLDRVLLARELQGIAYPEPRSDVLLAARGCAACLQWAAQARGLGLRVELDPLGLTPDALWQAARIRRIPRAVYPADEAHALLQQIDARAPTRRPDPEDGVAPHVLIVRDAAGARALAIDDWTEVTSWLSR